MISLYTTAFNLQNFNFCLQEVFNNWFYYVDEVVVSTFKNQTEEVQAVVDVVFNQGQPAISEIRR